MEKETATHSSILAGKIPWTEEPGGLYSMGSQRVRQDQVIYTHTHTHTRAQAVMQAMGVVVNKNEASLSHPPLTCHAAQVLTGYKSVPVHDPQVGNP